MHICLGRTDLQVSCRFCRSSSKEKYQSTDLRQENYGIWGSPSGLSIVQSHLSKTFYFRFQHSLNAGLHTYIQWMPFKVNRWTGKIAFPPPLLPSFFFLAELLFYCGSIISENKSEFQSYAKHCPLMWHDVWSNLRACLLFYLCTFRGENWPIRCQNSIFSCLFQK